MTQIIDQCFIKNQNDLDFYQLFVQSPKFKPTKIKLQEVVVKSLYQKRQWKINTVYYFHLQNAHVTNIIKTYKNQVKIKAKLTLLEHQMSLCLSLMDQLNYPIKCRSNYHKIVISKFCIQLNQCLEYYRLKINSITGQISYQLVLNVESFFLIDIEEMVNFILTSYEQEMYGHLYTLHLLQFIDSCQNMYIKNINQTLSLIKYLVSNKWKSFLKKVYSKNRQINDLLVTQQSQNSTQFTQSSLRQNEEFFKYDQKQVKNHLKQLKKYLLMNWQQTEQFNNSFQTNAKFYGEVKRFYQKQKIFSINLIRKQKMSNILNIQIKRNYIIEECILHKNDAIYDQINHQQYGKLQLYSKQSHVSHAKHDLTLQKPKVIPLQQKSTSKIITIQLLSKSPEASFQEYYICQTLTKYESLRFINQYVRPTNYSLIENGFILTYYVASKLSLRKFLQFNKNNLSLINKSVIAYHLVVIVYTIHQKNKILNYFPSIKIQNIEVSSNFSLNLKKLSNSGQVNHPPLFQLLQLLYFIFFQANIKTKKQSQNPDQYQFKTDQVFNSLFGPSFYINLIKFYLLNFYYSWKKSLLLQSFFSQNRQNTGSFIIQDKQLQKNKKKKLILNQKFNQICQNLMIVFGYISQFLGKQNNFEQDQTFNNYQKNN